MYVNTMMDFLINTSISFYRFVYLQALGTICVLNYRANVAQMSIARQCVSAMALQLIVQVVASKKFRAIYRCTQLNCKYESFSYILNFFSFCFVIAISVIAVDYFQICNCIDLFDLKSWLLSFYFISLIFQLFFLAFDFFLTLPQSIERQ